MHNYVNSYRIVGWQYSLTLLIEFFIIKVIHIYGFFKKVNATKVYKVKYKISHLYSQIPLIRGSVSNFIYL